MKKLNSEELTLEFNQLRLSHGSDLMSPTELYNLLRKYGFNKNLINTMKLHDVFLCEKLGTSRIYTFRNEPLYKGKMEEIIRDYRKSLKKIQSVEESTEESAINLLKSKGYVLKVCRGFDEARFAEENPELYQKYLIYEEA